MVGGKEVMGAEAREVRTGGREHHLPRPRPFRSPHDVRAESLGEAAVQQGWEGPGDQVWTPSQARQCMGHLWPGWQSPRCKLDPTIHSSASHAWRAEPWMGLGGPRGTSGRVKKSSLATPCLCIGQQ